jgi:pimeloyl-ACP methyl ester carboxylesterase
MQYPNGFNYTQTQLEGAYVDFVRQSDTLVVTFEFAGKPLVRPDGDRYGWGSDFMLKQGYSCLFVKPKKVDWYRNQSLIDFFDFISSTGFFEQFQKVIFIGGSMGGYAALAFSSLVPNSTVIALNPQVSLGSHIVPWENRFPVGRAQSWDGRYADASLEAKVAKQVWLVYDPFCVPDRLHADFLRFSNVHHCHIPFVGHRTPLWLKEMGILKDFMAMAIDGTLTDGHFHKLAKKRRVLKHYYVSLYRSLMSKDKSKKAGSIELVRNKANLLGFRLN